MPKNKKKKMLKGLTRDQKIRDNALYSAVTSMPVTGNITFAQRVEYDNILKDRVKKYEDYIRDGKEL